MPLLGEGRRKGSSCRLSHTARTWQAWEQRQSVVLMRFLSINEPQAFAKDFDHHFGKGGSVLLDMKISDFDAITTSLLSKMSKNHKEPGNLKECSPWMSEFKAEFLRNELEVPGKFLFSVNGELSFTRKLLLLNSTPYVGHIVLLSGLTQRKISPEITVHSSSLNSVLKL